MHVQYESKVNHMGDQLQWWSGGYLGSVVGI